MKTVSVRDVERAVRLEIIWTPSPSPFADPAAYQKSLIADCFVITTTRHETSKW